MVLLSSSFRYSDYPWSSLLEATFPPMEPGASFHIYSDGGLHARYSGFFLSKCHRPSGSVGNLFQYVVVVSDSFAGSSQSVSFLV